jgi:hypothetical protein
MRRGRRMHGTASSETAAQGVRSARAKTRWKRSTHRASRSDSSRARMSFSRTGPFTFRMIVRLVSSMNSTRTCVTPPREPVRPRTCARRGAVRSRARPQPVSVRTLITLASLTLAFDDSCAQRQPPRRGAPERETRTMMFCGRRGRRACAARRGTASVKPGTALILEFAWHSRLPQLLQSLCSAPDSEIDSVH